MRLEKRRKGTAILSECCPSPFGYIRNGRAIFTTPHNGEPHMLLATPEELRKLADEVERSCATIEDDKAA